MNKYKYFIVIDVHGNGLEVDEDKLLDHSIVDGLLILKFEDNDYAVHKIWQGIDYGYNPPQ